MKKIQVWMPRLQNEPLYAEASVEEISLRKEAEIFRPKRFKVTLPSRESVDVYFNGNAGFCPDLYDRNEPSFYIASPEMLAMLKPRYPNLTLPSIVKEGEEFFNVSKSFVTFGSKLSFGVKLIRSTKDRIRFEYSCSEMDSSMNCNGFLTMTNAEMLSLLESQSAVVTYPTNGNSLIRNNGYIEIKTKTGSVFSVNIEFFDNVAEIINAF